VVGVEGDRARGGVTRLVLAALLLICGCEPTSPSPSEATPLPPNVLLYVVDTLRADGLGSYGNPAVQTLAIDRLAAEGTLFESAYAAVPWTRPSVASILTGVRPGVHGVTNHRARMRKRSLLLSEAFREHGYRTGCIVANPNVGGVFGFNQGYGGDDFIELFVRRRLGAIGLSDMIARADEVSDRAIQWIDSASRPWFLFILAIDPHVPYEPPEPFDRYGAEDYAGSVNGRLDSVRDSDLTHSDKVRFRSLYDGEIALVDYSLSRLLSHLRARDLYDQTAIAFTSDHGEEFWDHGGTGHGAHLYDEVLRIPLIIRDVKTMPAGKRVSTPVESIDIFPTLLDIAGLPIPGDLEGRSLVRSVDERPVYATLSEHQQRLASVTVGSWKLIRDRRDGREQLYNLENDPGETTDRLAQNREKAGDLSVLLSHRLAEDEARRAEVRSEGDELGEVPEEVRAALEALGYARDDAALER
jgi:arylsulfatase A-like enzyme